MRAMNSRSRSTAALALSISLLLAACASTGPAPVEDLSGGHSRVVASPAPAREASGARSYRVQRGDTLYSIAFRNGLDYRELAAWNRIGAPYTIYAGQELRLDAPPRATVATAPRATETRSGVASTAPVTSSVPKPAPFEPLEKTPPPPTSPVAAAPPVSSGSATTATPPAQTPPSVPAAPPSTAPAAPPPVAATPPADSTATVGEVTWRWPADGSIVGSYVAGDPTRQGIDIAGKAGDPVRAAADGSVVYSGNGLVGYGELIIIKHNASYLSAYGHNRKRMVKEGDRVKSGQIIAEMGSSSASRDSLHFEIRKNGKPANPTDYLPRR